MRVQITLAVAAALAFPVAGCESQDDRAERTAKVIDQTRDDAAEMRARIQDKQEQLAEKRDQGEAASERGEFMAATEKTLQDLDRRIEQVKADVQKRGSELKGEARREIDQKLVDLENARAEAQTAFDRFRQATSEQAGAARQQTEASLQRARSAYDDLRGRVGDEDKDPDMSGSEEEPNPAVPPPTETGVEKK
jgi:chromosome segregation ATPase